MDDKDDFDVFPSSPERSDKVLVHDTSMNTTANNSFIEEFQATTQ